MKLVNTGRIEAATQVKLNEGSSPSGNQILDLANLVLAGSKQSIEYSVWRMAERSRRHGLTAIQSLKGDAGLRFNSFLFSYIAGWWQLVSPPGS